MVSTKRLSVLLLVVLLIGVLSLPAQAQDATAEATTSVVTAGATKRLRRDRHRPSMQPDRRPVLRHHFGTPREPTRYRSPVRAPATSGVRSAAPSCPAYTGRPADDRRRQAAGFGRRPATPSLDRHPASTTNRIHHGRSGPASNRATTESAIRPSRALQHDHSTRLTPDPYIDARDAVRVEVGQMRVPRCHH